ncbi:hypothetical protein AB4850_02930 [Burkholderia sp. 22PA0106]
MGVTARRLPAVSIPDTVGLVLTGDADAQFQNAVGRHVRAGAEGHAGFAREPGNADRHVDRLARLDLRQHGQRRRRGNPLARHLVGLLHRLLGLLQLRAQRVDLGLLTRERLRR